jgi:hypothetical protein
MSGVVAPQNEHVFKTSLTFVSLTGTSILRVCPYLPTNVGLALINLPRTDTLAYLAAASVTNKSVITLEADSL